MKTWLLLAMACCLSVFTYGQFEQMKGKLPWPVDNIKEVRRPSDSKGVRLGCPGYPELTIRSDSAMMVKACAGGLVARVFDIEGNWSVLMQHGDYFMVYNNLSLVLVAKGDTISVQHPLGRVDTANDDGLYELELCLSKGNKFIDPYPWLVPRVPYFVLEGNKVINSGPEAIVRRDEVAY